MDEMKLPEGFKPLTPEQVKKRRGRSVAIAWTIVALAFLFTSVAYVRMGDKMFRPHMPAKPKAVEAPKKQSSQYRLRFSTHNGAMVKI